MKHDLADGECRFDLMVQPQADPRKMPIDDPTVRWSERVSPFRTVATIRIPPQEFTSEAQRAFAENVSLLLTKRASGQGVDRLVAIERVFGSPFADHLLGTWRRELFFGDFGDDVIRARGGADMVYGEWGSDRVFGNNGDDRLIGGDDDDLVSGGPGDDTLNGGAGTDTCTSGAQLHCEL